MTVGSRRQFRLPEADEDFLDGFGVNWETLIEANLRWLILRAFPLPAGYDKEVADVAVLIQANYPPGLIESAYIFPTLGRTDGHVIPNANGRQQIDGRTWQFWSRHRTAGNLWIDGEDDLASHISWMESWLADEPKRTV